MFSSHLKKLLEKLKSSEKETLTQKENTPPQEIVKSSNVILDFIKINGVENKDLDSIELEITTEKLPNISSKSQKDEPIVPKKKNTIKTIFKPIDLSIFDEDGFSDRNEILDFVDDHGVEYKSSDKASSNNKQTNRSYRKKGAEERRIDLHGLFLEEAERLIISEIERAKKDGITQILIIHGRGTHTLATGRAVLKERVKQMLNRELEHLVESYKYVSGAEGGDGATRVFLR
jgi:DNA-nicking Smr family endonuclease